MNIILYKKISLTDFDDKRTLAGSSVLAISLSLSLGTQTFELGLLRLWTVLVQKTEHLGSSLSVKKVATKLVDGRGYFQTLVKNSATTLNANITRPFKETGQIALRLDGST